jgi:hypothetical protein
MHAAEQGWPVRHSAAALLARTFVPGWQRSGCPNELTIQAYYLAAQHKLLQLCHSELLRVVWNFFNTRSIDQYCPPEPTPGPRHSRIRLFAAICVNSICFFLSPAQGIQLFCHML